MLLLFATPVLMLVLRLALAVPAAGGRAAPVGGAVLALLALPAMFALVWSRRRSR
jgi:hypothetical protein